MVKEINENFNLFQPTETDRADLLAKLSDDILIANIEEQLKSTMINSATYNDMLAVFENRFQFITKFYPEDEIIIERCKDIKKSIYKKIYEEITERFSISSELDNNMDSDDFYFYTRELYNFLILKYKNNLIDFFVSYLYKNKKKLVKEYINEEEKKDLMFKSLKKTLDDNENILLLYYVEDIINNFAQYTDEPEDIIEEIISTDLYEATNFAMKELLIENRFNTFIEKTFTEEFLKPICDEEFQYDLYSTIRNNLMTLLKHEESQKG